MIGLILKQIVDNPIVKEKASMVTQYLVFDVPQSQMQFFISRSSEEKVSGSPSFLFSEKEYPYFYLLRMAPTASAHGKANNANASPLRVEIREVGLTPHDPQSLHYLLISSLPHLLVFQLLSGKVSLLDLQMLLLITRLQMMVSLRDALFRWWLV